MAMAFLEFTAKAGINVPLQIFATDLNDATLERARSGLYANGLLQNISKERLKRFFTEETDGHYRISKSVRELVVFARQNVFADPPFSRLDLISCRNLLIYLDPLLQARVIPTFHHALKAGGVLAFTDVALRQTLTTDEEARMAGEMQAPGIASSARYLALLRESGCNVTSVEDLSTLWTDTLVKRLAMYRSLADTTIAKFGQAHFDAWDRTYSFFVGLFVAGKLGGARIIARKH